MAKYFLNHLCSLVELLCDIILLCFYDYLNTWKSNANVSRTCKTWLEKQNEGIKDRIYEKANEKKKIKENKEFPLQKTLFRM